MTSEEGRRHLIDRLLDVWQRNPDLRLGQLVYNAYQDSARMFCASDADFVRRIEKFYGGERPLRADALDSNPEDG